MKQRVPIEYGWRFVWQRLAMMYAKRIGKTAYGAHNENSANRRAVHSQLWNIDRNAGAENLVRKIDER